MLPAWLGYKGNELYGERLPLRQLALKHGTPLYIYSKVQILENAKAYLRGFKKNKMKGFIAYSLKANANPHILSLLAKEGLGADVVSEGELRLALKFFKPQKIVYAGIGKSEESLRLAIKKGVLINVESEEEANLILDLSSSMKRKARVSLRVNLDVEANTHRRISTALTYSKFGIPYEEAINLASKIAKHEEVKLEGLHSHIGSQITKASPFRRAFRKLKRMYSLMRKKGISISTLDVGGGLGIPYKGEKVLGIDEYMRIIKEELGDLGVNIIVEPGRSIIANTSVLLLKVLFRKNVRGKTFVIVDGGFNVLIRPALYSAFHRLIPLVKRKANHKVEVVGPLCESTDTFGEYKLPLLKRGDYIAFLDVGAYGYSMASNYNGYPKPAEVLISKNRAYLIRKREPLSSLWRKG